MPVARRKLVEPGGVEQPAGGDDDGVAGVFQRHQPVLQQQPGRELRQQFLGRRRRVFQVDVRDVEVRGQGAQQLFLGHAVDAAQHLVGRSTGGKLTAYQRRATPRRKHLRCVR